jgi:hypothetical protein
MDNKLFINRVKSDIPDNYFDSAIWEKEGKTYINIVVRSLEGLDNWKKKIIEEFCLEDTVFNIVKASFTQSPEERDRLTEMSYSDADPGL